MKSTNKQHKAWLLLKQGVFVTKLVTKTIQFEMQAQTDVEVKRGLAEHTNEGNNIKILD